MKFARRAEPREPRPHRTAEVLERMPVDSGASFSLEKDITSEEIYEANEAIQELMYDSNTWYRDSDYPVEPWSKAISRFSGSLAVVLQDHKGLLDFNPIYTALREEIEEVTPGGDDFYTILSALILIAPERRKSLDSLLSEELRRSRVVNIHATGRQYPYREAIEFGIVHPGYINELGFDEEQYHLHRTTVEEAVDAQDFCSSGMFLRLFYPSHAKELELDSDIWDMLKSELKIIDPTSRGFWEMAMGMAILAAEKAEFTDTGFIQITPHQSAMQKPEPLPQRHHV